MGPKLAVVVLSLSAVSAYAQPYALVAGFDSGTVVRFDLASGQSTTVISLGPNTNDAGPRPRGVAVDGAGHIYVGLRGGAQDVQRFTASGLPLGDFTSPLSPNGTGHLAFDAAGNLLVAADSNIIGGTAVCRYNGATGSLMDTLTQPGVINVVGMTVSGTRVFAAGAFSNSVLRFDLSQSPVQGTTLVTGSGLNRPTGLTIGHNGNLFVSEQFDGIVREFDPNSGAVVGTLVDLASYGFAHASDIAYDGVTNRYYVTNGGSDLFALDTSGALVATYHSDALAGAGGITIVPAPSTAVMLALGLVAARRRRASR